ncbi:uncharacterized protein LOC126839433 [Adelges cooleyi]|uniref:uncharacterized protein LOC126839433 n=1 Tax=Adelges cooleyi TaxID=133065 RepID=UPI00217F7A07|nr:uncharacterized protein LOC126839433 [Adelges cooleyi]
MSATGVRCCVARSVLVAVAALASCTDSATIVLRMKDSAEMVFKPVRTVLAGSAAAVSSTATTTTTLGEFKGKTTVTTQGGFNFTAMLNIANNVSQFMDEEDQDGAEDEDDALSAVWYLAAFGGLVLFFFVVTCSELFFGNPIYTRRPVELPHAGYLRRHVYGRRNQGYTPETPPPPYHLFAPPSYADTIKGLPPYESGNKKLADVYVVPVHGGGGVGDTGVTSLQPPPFNAAATTGGTIAAPARTPDDRKPPAQTKR